MTDATRRKNPRDPPKCRPPAGVDRIVNRAAVHSLLGSASTLDSVAGKPPFARSTGVLGALVLAIEAGVAAYSLNAFDLEILETIAREPEPADASPRRGLETLAALWREKLGPDNLY